MKFGIYNYLHPFTIDNTQKCDTIIKISFMGEINEQQKIAVSGQS